MVSINISQKHNATFNHTFNTSLYYACKQISRLPEISLIKVLFTFKGQKKAAMS